MKVKSMNAKEKRLVSQLRRAEARREARKRATLSAYVMQIDGVVTLPFFALNDAIAIDCATSLIHDEHLEDKCPDLICVGSYCLLDAKISACPHRFVSYTIIARPPKRPHPSGLSAKRTTKAAIAVKSNNTCD